MDKVDNAPNLLIELIFKEVRFITLYYEDWKGKVVHLQC